MQIRYATGLSAEEYVRQQAWKQARLENCPIHPEGGCGFGKNGTYGREYPEGTKVARWYCALGHTTFGLLPDCLSSRLSGSLNEVESVVVQVEQSPSQEEAAKNIRMNIDLPSVLRWIRRRVKPVQNSLAMLIEIAPFLFSDCNPTISSFRCLLCVEPVLVDLRSRASPYLHLLPPPLGFGPRIQRKKIKKMHFQHETGTDPPVKK
ncbi:MAG: hypothetical protein JRJ00_09120 [Deltaproteobacteria bacterium]|nr:hypothetical protein [Deltaproteobacteria bacterium]